MGVSGRDCVRCVLASRLPSLPPFLLPPALFSSLHHPTTTATPKHTPTLSSMHAQAPECGRGHGNGVLGQSKDEGKQSIITCGRRCKASRSSIQPPLDAACASASHGNTHVPSRPYFADVQTNNRPARQCAQGLQVPIVLFRACLCGLECGWSK